MTKSNAAPLVERIHTLLQNRQQIRTLIQSLTAHKLRLEPLGQDDLEKRIANLVTGPLDLGPRELPGARSLALCASALLVAFAEPHLLDQPSLVWNKNPLTMHGESTQSWHPLIKQRLTALCGPLDETLVEMLDGAGALCI